MKRLALATMSTLFLLNTPAFAQQQVPEIPYESVPNFFKLPPDMNFGEGAGVAANSKGHIFVFTRSNSALGPAYGATASQLLEFGPDGRFIREIGKGLYAWSFAHVVRVDKDDNIWCVDKGSDMVVKFNPEGHVVMVFGRKKEASDEGAAPWDHPKPPRPPVDGQFRQPTDVTWDPQGNIYISDGYINSRIAKLDKNGDWVKSWGEPGTGQGQLNTPHTITSDAQGNIYVGDRGNGRVQVFDGDGKFLREIKINVPVPAGARSAIGATPNADVRGTMAPGAPWAICITPGPTQYLYVADAFPGRIYKLTLDGTVLGTFGKAGKQPKQFGWVHEIHCQSENELYIAEVLNWRAQKLVLHPEKKTSTAGDKP